MIDTPMTELDAVNQMLLTIGSQKVNSLDASGLIEVDVAKSTLRDVSRDVQGAGWHFNTEYKLRLLPDTEGYVHVPRNCLQARLSHPKWRTFIVQRGTRMYNLRTHSYVFDSPLFVDVVLFLGFDELIPAARRYIAMRAARRFQERVMGSQVTEEFAMAEEFDARAELQAADARDAGYNILEDNWPTVSTVTRDHIY